MPELPEVETVCRGLAPLLTRSPIAAVTLNRPDLRFPFPDAFEDRLAGRRITKVARRAKYILAETDGPETLIMHMGMSGRFVIHDPVADAPAPPRMAYERAPDVKHDHVVLEMADGALVTFNDPRRFGFMDLSPTRGLETCRWFEHLGPEPLERRFSGPMLADALSTKATSLKAALLDQRLVVGVGNIYACEALFRAKLHPERLGRDVAEAEAASLARAVKKVLREAIEAGGSTLRDFAGASGEMGYFQHAFRVYGREGEPCMAPGCPGEIKRIVQSNRSTFYCPRCQI